MPYKVVGKMYNILMLQLKIIKKPPAELFNRRLRVGEGLVLLHPRPSVRFAEPADAEHIAFQKQRAVGVEFHIAAIGFAIAGIV